jgi:hypothetical protein
MTRYTDERPWLHDDAAYQLGQIGPGAKAAAPLLRKTGQRPRQRLPRESRRRIVEGDARRQIRPLL